MSNESFFAWIHVWVADKAAGSVEQSRQICLFAPRQCGTTAMTTGAGLDIYLACWLMSLNCLKALQGNFFSPFFFPPFLPLVLELGIQCFSLYACVRFCVNTADKVELLREGQWAVISSLWLCWFVFFPGWGEGHLVLMQTLPGKTRKAELWGRLGHFSMTLLQVEVQWKSNLPLHCEDFQGLWLENPALLCLFGPVPLPVIAYLWNLPKLF